MLTIRELRDREIVLRSLREGIDTSNATGRMIAGVLASLAELELELTRDGILIWDYNLMRAQGLRACYQESAGLSGLRAVYNLSPPYDFDTANSIVAAANVVYCPWNLGN